MGYHLAGFDVVGVDHKPQPRYPFRLYEGDALWVMDHLLAGKPVRFAMPDGRTASKDERELPEVFRLKDFDAIHASPPCQAYTTALRWNETARKKHKDLVAPTRAALERSGLPWIMENVPDAPLKNFVVLCGSMFGLRTACGAELRRHRLFETNWDVGLVPACQHGSKTVTVVGGGPCDPAAVKRRQRRTISVAGATPQRNIKTPMGEGAYAQSRETFTVDDARQAMGIDWLTMKGLSQAIPPAYTEFLGRRLRENVFG